MPKIKLISVSTVTTENHRLKYHNSEYTHLKDASAQIWWLEYPRNVNPSRLYYYSYWKSALNIPKIISILKWMKFTSLELILLQTHKTNRDKEKYKEHYKVLLNPTLHWNASSGAPPSTGHLICILMTLEERGTFHINFLTSFALVSHLFADGNKVLD